MYELRVLIYYSFKSVSIREILNRDVGYFMNGIDIGTT
jgi:hypothetical protein